MLRLLEARDALGKVNDLCVIPRIVVSHAVVILARQIPTVRPFPDFVYFVVFVVNELRRQMPASSIREQHETRPLEVLRILDYLDLV
jgi:hypothetical protein